MNKEEQIIDWLIANGYPPDLWLIDMLMKYEKEL